MRSMRDDEQELARPLLHAVASPDEGALQIVDRMSDILGEPAVLALVRYAADATVTDRLGSRPRLDRAGALQLAGLVSQASMRAVADGEAAYEVEARPGPGLRGVRPSVTAALCEGALEGMYKVIFRSPTARSETSPAGDGRALRIRVGRG